MKKITAFLAVLTLLLGASFAVQAEEEEAPPLYALAAAHGFKMGAPLSYGQIWDQNYLTLVKTHFNSITATNEMKAYSMLDQHGSRTRADGMPAINFRMADQMVAWAQENGIGVRGHVLVWDAYMTDWFFHEEYNPSKPYADQETIRTRTKYYITQVVTHFETKFPGVVYCWDVVNEAVGDNPGEYAAGDARHLRTKRGGGVNLFQKFMGDDYVERSFLYARNAVEALGADIKLYYNDYNAFYPDKAQAIRALAESVNHFAQDESGAYRKLMDGIGMQGYIGGYGEQNGCLEDQYFDMFRKEITAYAGMDLEVQITEMALRNYDLSQAGRHAEYYGELFRLFISLGEDGVNPLKAISIWGLTDYPREPKTSNIYKLNSPYCGLVDENLQYKDAFYEVYEALK